MAIITDRQDASLTDPHLSIPGIDPCFDERVAAKILGVSPAFLRKRRRLGLPPRFVRFGRAVRYSAPDLRAFVENSCV